MFLLETNKFSGPTINKKLFKNYSPGHPMDLISCQQENYSLQGVFSDIDEDIADPMPSKSISHDVQLEGMLARLFFISFPSGPEKSVVTANMELSEGLHEGITWSVGDLMSLVTSTGLGMYDHLLCTLHLNLLLVSGVK